MRCNGQQAGVDLEVTALGGGQRDLKPHVALAFDEVHDTPMYQPVRLVSHDKNRSANRGAEKYSCTLLRKGGHVQNLHILQLRRSRYFADLDRPVLNSAARRQALQLGEYPVRGGDGDRKWRIPGLIARPFNVARKTIEKLSLDGIGRIRSRRRRRSAGRKTAHEPERGDRPARNTCRVDGKCRGASCSRGPPVREIAQLGVLLNSSRWPRALPRHFATFSVLGCDAAMKWTPFRVRVQENAVEFRGLDEAKHGTGARRTE